MGSQTGEVTGLLPDPFKSKRLPIFAEITLGDKARSRQKGKRKILNPLHSCPGMAEDAAQAVSETKKSRKMTL